MPKLFQLSVNDTEPPQVFLFDSWYEKDNILKDNIILWCKKDNIGRIFLNIILYLIYCIIYLKTCNCVMYFLDKKYKSNFISEKRKKTAYISLIFKINK